MKNILTLNYQNYSYKLINGDITEQIESLPEKSIDLILTDPPYGITDAAWDTIIPITFIKKLFEKVRKSDRTPMLLFGAEPFSSLLRTGGGVKYHISMIGYGSKKLQQISLMRNDSLYATLKT